MRNSFLFLILTAASLQASDPRNFPVTLGNCTEFIGTKQIPVASVAPLVPSSFLIAGAETGFATLVIRAGRCGRASVDGGPVEDARVAQVGVVLIPPDGTGGINNYTLSYSTNSLRLAARLELAGLNVTLDPDLVYEVSPDPPVAGGEFFFDVSPLAAPAWFLSGRVTDPAGPQFPFVANWWSALRAGKLKMATSIPLLAYGDGSVRIYSRRGGLVGRLIGGNSTGFEVNLRGVFANATMQVSVVP